MSDRHIDGKAIHEFRRWVIRSLPIAILSLALPGLAAREPKFDLVIRNGRVLDGTGAAVVEADVAIRNGRVAAVRKGLGNGKSEIDVRGQIVAPGFIDVHSHGENITELPLGENYARMGVASIVVGNCGGSELDLDAFWKELQTKGVSLNVASLIGHNTVRRSAMGGNFDRAPTPAELEKMEALVDRAMRAGAVGLSTGLIYLPGTFSRTPEVVALAKVAAKHNGLYASHMRNEGTGIFNALNELLTVAREGGIPAHVSHIKLGGRSAWGRASQVLELLDQANASGLKVTQDQYVYTASSTRIGTMVPSRAREGGTEKYLERLANPAYKADLVAEMKGGLWRRAETGYSYAVVASCRWNRALNGKTVPEAARLLRGADSLDDQIETILEIVAKGDAQGVFHGMDEADLRTFLRHPNTMIAADSGVQSPGPSVPHPRGYGNNARVLNRYVREMGDLKLEEAVRRMTSLPAQTFRLRDRGTLKPGSFADIVVLDPAAVRDPATFAEPQQYATGIRHLLVNGKPVIRDGDHTKAPAGVPLRLSPSK